MSDLVSFSQSLDSITRHWRRLPSASWSRRWSNRELDGPALNCTMTTDVKHAYQLVLDAEGKVIFASPAAITTLQRFGVAAQLHERLQWGSASDTGEIQLALLHCRTNRSQPIVFRGEQSGVLVGLLSRQGSGYVLRLAPSAPVKRIQQLLADQFKLTPTQCEVALSLGSGVSLGDVALQRGTSINTVRTHANAVFEKMSVRRQGELVSLLQQLQALVVDES